ncbi:MAG: hypothetical protein R3195_18005, partial [Gemmatimonadota bacterium]|nr:hypothetical protein [Gemmatimonadota bacterium]
MGSSRRRRSTAFRLLATCWLVYSFHFATNMVRESYLALAIGDHMSFRVDEYAGMHDDIFEHPGHGWHIGSNPGASMLAAIPYAISRPAVDAIVSGVRERRAEAGATRPPDYEARNAADLALYEEAWRRGFDVKFGLASAVMQSLCMAVVAALGVVLMYFLLAGWFGERAGSWLAVLYAFGTPLFLRTGFLNHNAMMATFALAGFTALWMRPPARAPTRPPARLVAAGLAGGMCVLLDYSGVIVLAVLGVAAFCVRPPDRPARVAGLFALGAVGPLLLLWWYQWRAFGHPLYPPQHWMPVVEYIEEGYQGVSLPRPDLAALLAFDYRFGLFTSCPLFLLALAGPLVNRRASGDGGRRAEDDHGRVPTDVVAACVAVSLGLFIFFSGVHYTRWQFNTGVRYLAPAFPFLFILSAIVLVRLPGWLARTIGIASVAFAWMLAMARDVSGGKVELADPDAGRG